MRRAQTIDVLLVSLGSTEGLRRADDELHDALNRAGARVAVVRAHPVEPVPTMMLTDLRWARAARDVLNGLIEQQREMPPRSILYSTTTAALLCKRPGAIRFDATAAGNRPGRHGLWQRPLERRRLRQAPLLLPWSEGALAEAPGIVAREDRTLVLPVPVEPSGPIAAERDVAAVAYTANPAKKGLDRVLAAWRQVREQDGGDGELLLAGASAEQLRHAGLAIEQEGVRVLGSLPAAEFRGLLRRARTFVCAPRREDYGIVQLEALADGCLLVTTPSPGPYVALPVARELDARFVGEDLVAGLRAALS
ncbi:MAG TPA: glycosyltransferase, partial [Solirubrobacteraceae bacterium]|nr:glycosyltransferase [Solirubrobacteraceae bacterium]